MINATNNRTFPKAFEAHWLLKSTSETALTIFTLWTGGPELTIPQSFTSLGHGLPIRIAGGRHVVGGFLWRTGAEWQRRNGDACVCVCVCMRLITYTGGGHCLSDPSLWLRVTDATAERSSRMMLLLSTMLQLRFHLSSAIYFARAPKHFWPHHSMTS